MVMLKIVNIHFSHKFYIKVNDKVKTLFYHRRFNGKYRNNIKQI